MFENEIFRHLIAPLSEKEFFSKFWDKEVLHITRNDKAYFNSFIIIKEIDVWFRDTPLYYPAVQLRGMEANTINWYKDLIENGNYSGKKIHKQRLLKYFQRGNSILVNNFSHFNPRLNQRVKALRKYFNCKKVKDHLIISPPNQNAFAIHYDKEHVIAFQLAGTKNWYFHDRPAKNLRKEVISFNIHTNSKVKKTMKPGDVLYIPAGLFHHTETISDENSLSISIAIDLFNGRDILKNAIDNAVLNFPTISTMMPPNSAAIADKTQYFNQLKQNFINYLNSASFDTIVKNLQLKSYEEKNDNLSILQITQQDEINQKTKILVKQNVDFQLFRNNKVLHFKYNHKVLHFSAFLESGIKYILENTPCKVEDIPLLLPPNEKIKLIKKLVQEKIIEVTV